MVVGNSGEIVKPATMIEPDGSSATRQASSARSSARNPSPRREEDLHAASLTSTRAEAGPVARVAGGIVCLWRSSGRFQTRGRAGIAPRHEPRPRPSMFPQVLARGKLRVSALSASGLTPSQERSTDAWALPLGGMNPMRPAGAWLSGQTSPTAARIDPAQAPWKSHGSLILSISGSPREMRASSRLDESERAGRSPDDPSKLPQLPGIGRSRYGFPPIRR